MNLVRHEPYWRLERRESLLCDPMVDPSYDHYCGRETGKRKGEDNKWDGTAKTKCAVYITRDEITHPLARISEPIFLQSMP